jgi:hypothetical protein
MKVFDEFCNFIKTIDRHWADGKPMSEIIAEFPVRKKR